MPRRCTFDFSMISGDYEKKDPSLRIDQYALRTSLRTMGIVDGPDGSKTLVTRRVRTVNDVRSGYCDIDIPSHGILTRGKTEGHARSLPMIQYLRCYLRCFTKNEDGATAIEYGLIAAGIAVAIIAAVGLLGDSLSGTFTDVKDELDGS